MSLRLVRRPGRPNWYLKGTVRGVAVRESTGIALANKEAAETVRAQREWQVIQGSVFGQGAVATFLAAAVGYLEQDGEGTFLQPILDRIGDVRLADIDQALIDKTARELYPGRAPATLNRQAYTPIAAVLRFAAKRGMTHLRAIERPTLPKGRVRWLTFAEAERLLRACSPHLRRLVLFLFATGARVSEALYLDWREVDLKRAQVTFLDTKNGEHRSVPLHPRVAAELAALPRRRGRVFKTNRGKDYAEKEERGGGQIKTGFRAACRRAKIKNFRPHDCRHTWATWHYAANRDLASLMTLGGWKSERMVLRYAHVNVAQLAPSIANALAVWGAGNNSNNRTRARSVKSW